MSLALFNVVSRRVQAALLVEFIVVIGLLAVMASTPGCTTSPASQTALSPDAQAALQASVRIAVRHYVQDHADAAAKVGRIRAIVAQVQAVTSATSTVPALKEVAKAEIAKSGLSAADLADANDLLDLLAVALESRLSQAQIDATGIVRVNEFLQLILDTLPTGA